MNGDTGIPPIDITRYAWGRRAMMKNAPFIQNQNGSRSTHLMAADVDHMGNWWAYPTIVQIHDGSLYQFQNPALAMAWNLKNGEAVPFGRNKDMALKFAEGGYKKGTPLEELKYF